MKPTASSNTCILVLMTIALCVSSSARSTQAADYLKQVSYKPKDAEYFDLVNKVVQLTPEEMTLLQKSAFVVTERLSYFDFIQAYAWIYNKDLPVMITTVSMLEAVHQAQSDLLMHTETSIFTPILKNILNRTLSALHAAKDKSATSRL